jgi:NAD(P)H-dependent flavin oxidoreductase YrpB (nitropropane dioxygenase family)
VGGALPSYTPYEPIRFEDQLRVLLEENVPAFSFIYGIPPKEVINECRQRGIAIIGTATTVDEAVALEEAGEAGTTALTRGFTGRLARGIKNQLLDELNKKGTEILPYPLQRALVRHLSIPAEKAGRWKLLTLWAGQSARLSHCEDVNVLLSDLVTQVSAIAGDVQRWSATRSSRPQPETS